MAHLAIAAVRRAGGPTVAFVAKRLDPAAGCRQTDRPDAVRGPHGDARMTDQTAVLSAQSHALAINRTLRQTYLLLAIVMAIAAAGAGIGLAAGLTWSIGMWVVFMAVFIGGPFLIHKRRDSQASIGITMGWAGLVGFLLSPMVAAYLAIPGGPTIVLNALATTALLFGALSIYAVSTRKDFSFMGGFLMVGLVLVLIAIVANLFLQVPLLSLVISGAAVLLMCGLILFDTSRMVNGGETNPVVLTVSLFANIVVLFSHLLHLFAVLSGDD
jgi:modulator of FtsH protease